MKVVEETRSHTYGRGGEIKITLEMKLFGKIDIDRLSFNLPTNTKCGGDWPGERGDGEEAIDIGEGEGARGEGRSRGPEASLGSYTVAHTRLRTQGSYTVRGVVLPPLTSS